MAFYRLPDGQQLAQGVAFKLGGVYYPSNWLALSTPEDRLSVGIEGPFNREPIYDREFYLGINPDGSLIPKDVDEVRNEYIAHIRRNSKGILDLTDWMVIRQLDNGTPIPLDIQNAREAIRKEAQDKISVLGALTELEDIKSYVKSTDYSFWPGELLS